MGKQQQGKNLVRGGCVFVIMGVMTIFFSILFLGILFSMGG